MSAPAPAWLKALIAPLHGPACPCCYRDDGTHVVVCRVPEYVAEWSRLNRERGEQVADLMWPRAASANSRSEPSA